MESANADVFYFSGSGNSLVVARDIAKELDGNLIPIPSIMDKTTIETDAEVIGIVFPVYYADFGGIPLIISRFVNKLKNLSSKYIFAVCTHAGGPRRTIENFDELLKLSGGCLAGGFTVKMSVPFSTGIKIKRALFHREINAKEAIAKDFEEQQELYEAWEEKLEVISNYVSNRAEGRLETTGALVKIISAPFLPLSKLMFTSRYRKLAEVSSEESEDASNLTFDYLVQHADKSFQANDRCTGCGICKRLCPVDNIEIVNNRPEWQHHCETCYACYYWCPQDAIHGEIVAYNKKYHHPDVSLSDMLKQNE